MMDDRDVDTGLPGHSGVDHAIMPLSDGQGERISDERMAEIREDDRRDYANGQIIKRRPRSAIVQRRELLAEIGRLKGELAKSQERGNELYEHNGRILAAVLRVDGAATRLQRRLARARALLQRFVDRVDEACDADHNGYCQAHGLSPAPCKIAEARAFLAELTQIDELAKRNATVKPTAAAALDREET